MMNRKNDGSRTKTVYTNSLLHSSMRLVDINKPNYSDRKKQVERGGSSPGRQYEPQRSRQQSAVAPRLSILQLVTLIRSLAGPPPAQLSLTDGLFNWQWRRGAQPGSGETSLTKDTASRSRMDFCLTWYGKPMSQCHNQISTVSTVLCWNFCQGLKSRAEFSRRPVSSWPTTGNKISKSLHSPAHKEEHCSMSPPVGFYCIFLMCNAKFVLETIIAGCWLELHDMAAESF